MYEWSEVARLERWEDSEVHGRRDGKVMRWQFGKGWDLGWNLGRYLKFAQGILPTQNLKGLMF